MAKATKEKFDAGKALADRMIELLEKGVSPWHCPWESAGFVPCSVDDRPYRGVNILVLGMTAALKGYKSPYWATFKKCRDLGGSVKKGEKGTLVVYWMRSVFQRKDEDGNPIYDDDGNPVMGRRFAIKGYTVFNAEQCEGLPDKFFPKAKPVAKTKRLKNAEAIWNGYKDKPSLKFNNGETACYSTKNDTITVPRIGQFKDAGEYYATLFHEACHSTGHPKRLNRNMRNMFGSEEYGKEELVAEIGAQLLCQSVGITRTLANAAAYCKGWAKAIKSCPDYGKAIVCAAAQAQKAADYIKGVTYKEEN